MLDLSAFSLADLQNAMQVLHHCESIGVSSVGAARDRIADAARKHRWQARTETVVRAKRGQVQASLDVCPQCGARAIVISVINGERIETCKACRWSRYIGEVA